VKPLPLPVPKATKKRSHTTSGALGNGRPTPSVDSIQVCYKYQRLRVIDLLLPAESDMRPSAPDLV